MGRPRDLANILSSSGSVALDSEVGLFSIIPTSVTAVTGTGTISPTGLITISGCSSISINGCFTSSYNDYLLLVNFTGASINQALSGRLRSSGSDITGSVYDKAGVILATNSTSVSQNVSLGQTSWDLGNNNTTYPTYTQLELLLRNPQSGNAFKIAYHRMMYVNASGYGTTLNQNLSVSTASQCDGFSLIASTGNFTGTAKVYGYRN